MVLFIQNRGHLLGTYPQGKEREMTRRGLSALFSAVTNYIGSSGPIPPLGLVLMKSQKSRAARPSWTQPRLKETATEPQTVDHLQP